MLLLDVNVLVAAHRADHPDHEPVRRWVDGLLLTDEGFAVPASVWSSFLRLVTNRRVFGVPTPRVEAFAFVEAVLAQPNHLVIGPGDRHLVLLRHACESADAVGDLVPDAVLVALAVEHGCEIVSLDRDFARFTEVRHRNPVEG